MEARLNAILARIDASNLSDDEKVKLYGIISEGMKAAIWPSLVSHMPKDQLEQFTKTPSKDAVVSYLALIEQATADGKALDEIDTTLNGLLDEVESVLTEEHI